MTMLYNLSMILDSLIFNTLAQRIGRNFLIFNEKDSLYLNTSNWRFIQNNNPYKYPKDRLV